MEQVSFTDSNGAQWAVREDGANEAFASGRDEHVPGTAWLRFESDHEVRRLWHYPDDWRGLSPIQLESLLERASTVIARFRPAPDRRTVPDLNARPARTPPAAVRQPPARPDDGPAPPGRKPVRHDDP